MAKKSRKTEDVQKTTVGDELPVVSKEGRTETSVPTRMLFQTVSVRVRVKMKLPLSNSSDRPESPAKIGILIPVGTVNRTFHQGREHYALTS